MSIGIILGSTSNRGSRAPSTRELTPTEVMHYCIKILEEHNIKFTVIVASADREPEKVRESIKNVSKECKVIIVAAGTSAALPGVVAAYTDLPVIVVPMTYLDRQLSISQMPKGVPVACMSIGKAGAIDAALYAKRILDLIYGGEKAAGRVLEIKNQCK